MTDDLLYANPAPHAAAPSAPPKTITMTLDQARTRVHVVISSSHLPGWKQNREAWAVVQSAITELNDTKAYIQGLRQRVNELTAELAQVRSNSGALDGGSRCPHGYSQTVRCSRCGE